ILHASLALVSGDRTPQPFCFNVAYHRRLRAIPSTLEFVKVWNSRCYARHIVKLNPNAPRLVFNPKAFIINPRAYHGRWVLRVSPVAALIRTIPIFAGGEFLLLELTVENLAGRVFKVSAKPHMRPCGIV